MSRAVLLSGFAAMAAGSAVLNQQAAKAEPPRAATEPAHPAEAELSPAALQDQATRVFETYCVSCHGPQKQEGTVRLDALETIDAVDLQALYATAQDVLHFGEMPPEGAKQPSERERKLLMHWLSSQLTGDAAKKLAEKLQRSEYANVVEHEALFSGEHADKPGYTEDRRWLISEYIFNEKVNGLLNYIPTRTIYGELEQVRGDSGIHWSPKSERGSKFRRTITNPFLLPDKVGVQYYMHEALTTGHLLTMIGNAKIIAGHMASEPTLKQHYPATLALMETQFEHRAILRSREQFLTTYTYLGELLKDIYKNEHEAMLPEFEPLDLPYPQPVTKNGKVQIETNLGLLGRQDQTDLMAVYRGMHAYQDNGVEYDHVIKQSERDWVIEGVAESRIHNRVSMMKAFRIHWDFEGITRKAMDQRYAAPEYIPLNNAEMSVITKTVKKHRKPGDTYLEIIDKCTAEWKATFRAEREAVGSVADAEIAEAVIELHEKVFERRPTEAELADSIALMKSYLGKLDMQPAIAKLIESMVLRTEFVYREEFGVGEADEHGRRMMSPRDASYALAYALTDSGPDAELVKAAEEGRLNTRADYEREVRRMLERRDQWTIIDEAVQAANLNASVTNQPIRKLRFFRDFFGYPKAMKVFKDDHRFGAGKYDQAVSRLIDEADLLVEHILEKDERVFETLLTTDKFYAYHNGDNEAMQTASHQLRKMYEYFKDYEWQDWEPEDVATHMSFMKNFFEFRKTKGDTPEAYLRTLKRLMPLLELHFSEGQSNAMPYMKLSMGFWHGGPVLGRTSQQMRGEQVTSFWNIDWRTWDYPTQQPAKIPNRKGMLTHPAWLIAHAQNLETDPIHRGKWVREKLLAGNIPDVPITVDAVIPEDHTMTLRQRMEDRTGDTYCWQCHKKMDPLGFPFEQYGDFGRFRTEEKLEHPDNLIKEADRERLNKFGASLPVYKTLPVDPRGVLNGTDDSTLDGDVKDALDMIDRLAKSDKVRQSIIRYAFRYFLGRNETLSDSKTLMDAERAYLESNGSFDAVIVSLLTSDSFIYRIPNTQD